MTGNDDDGYGDNPGQGPSGDEHGYGTGPEQGEAYDFVDASELRTGAPWWVVVLVGALSLAVGAGLMLLSGYTREDLLAEEAQDASPVVTSVCSASANVRSTNSLTGDVVDTLRFGDEISGMLSGAWVKLGEGRYVSVSVLCDLTTAADDTVVDTATDSDETTATAPPGPDEEQATSEPDGPIAGTAAGEGTGDGTLDLPEDARTGVLTFTHTGDGPFVLGGLDEDGEPAATPSLSVSGDYSGTVVFGLDNDVTELTVDTAGAWSLTVAPLETAPVMAEDGIGSPATAAFYLGEDPGLWRFNPTAPANLVQYGVDGSTASAELTGPSDVELMGGGSYLVVYTAGPWTADRVDAGP